MAEDPTDARETEQRIRKSNAEHDIDTDAVVPPVDKVFAQILSLETKRGDDGRLRLNHEKPWYLRNLSLGLVSALESAKQNASRTLSAYESKIFSIVDGEVKDSLASEVVASQVDVKYLRNALFSRTFASKNLIPDVEQQAGQSHKYILEFNVLKKSESGDFVPLQTPTFSQVEHPACQGFAGGVAYPVDQQAAKFHEYMKQVCDMIAQAVSERDRSADRLKLLDRVVRRYRQDSDETAPAALGAAAGRFNLSGITQSTDSLSIVVNNPLADDRTAEDDREEGRLWMVLAVPQYNIDKTFVPVLTVDKLKMDMHQLCCQNAPDAEGNTTDFLDCQAAISYWSNKTQEVHSLTVKRFVDTDHCIMRGYVYREFVPKHVKIDDTSRHILDVIRAPQRNRALDAGDRNLGDTYSMGGILWEDERQIGTQSQHRERISTPLQVPLMAANRNRLPEHTLMGLLNQQINDSVRKNRDDPRFRPPAGAQFQSEPVSTEGGENKNLRENVYTKPQREQLPTPCLVQHNYVPVVYHPVEQPQVQPQSEGGGRRNHGRRRGRANAALPAPVPRGAYRNGPAWTPAQYTAPTGEKLRASRELALGEYGDEEPDDEEEPELGDGFADFPTYWLSYNGDGSPKEFWNRLHIEVIRYDSGTDVVACTCVLDQDCIRDASGHALDNNYLLNKTPGEECEWWEVLTVYLFIDYPQGVWPGIVNPHRQRFSARGSENSGDARPSWANVGRARVDFPPLPASGSGSAPPNRGPSNYRAGNGQVRNDPSGVYRRGGGGHGATRAWYDDVYHNYRNFPRNSSGHRGGARGGGGGQRPNGPFTIKSFLPHGGLVYVQFDLATRNEGFIQWSQLYKDIQLAVFSSEEWEEIEEKGGYPGPLQNWTAALSKPFPESLHRFQQVWNYYLFRLWPVSMFKIYDLCKGDLGLRLTTTPFQLPKPLDIKWNPGPGDVQEEYNMENYLAWETQNFPNSISSRDRLYQRENFAPSDDENDEDEEEEDGDDAPVSETGQQLTSSAAPSNVHTLWRPASSRALQGRAQPSSSSSSLASSPQLREMQRSIQALQQRLDQVLVEKNERYMLRHAAGMSDSLFNARRS